MRYLGYSDKIFLTLLVIVLLISCSKPHLVVPDIKDGNLDMLFRELAKIRGLEATMEVEFDKGDSLINGDMFLKADDKNMIIRLYYLGFPAGEIIEKDGEIKNTIKISKKRAEMFTQGLKKSLFWWKNEFNQVIEYEDTYTLLAKDIVIILDRKTLLPKVQTVRLPDGEIVDIEYSVPKQVEPEQKTGSIIDWYQSVINLSYRNYKALSKVSSLTIIRE